MKITDKLIKKEIIPSEQCEKLIKLGFVVPHYFSYSDNGDIHYNVIEDINFKPAYLYSQLYNWCKVKNIFFEIYAEDYAVSKKVWKYYVSENKSSVTSNSYTTYKEARYELLNRLITSIL